METKTPSCNQLPKRCLKMLTLEMLCKTCCIDTLLRPVLNLTKVSCIAHIGRDHQQDQKQNHLNRDCLKTLHQLQRRMNDCIFCAWYILIKALAVFVAVAVCVGGWVSLAAYQPCSSSSVSRWGGHMSQHHSWPCISCHAATTSSPGRQSDSEWGPLPQGGDGSKWSCSVGALWGH